MNTEEQKVPKPSLLHRIGHVGATMGRRSPNRRSTKLILQIGVPVVVFAALIYVLVNQWDKLPDYSWHFSAGWLIASAATFIAYYVVIAVVWRLIIHFLGERLRTESAQAIYAKSLLARYVPGNMLMVITRVIMAEREGVSRKASLTSVVYELGITFSTAIAVASYFIFTLPQLEGTVWRYLALLVIPAMLIFLHPRVFRPVVNWCLHKLGREPLPAVLKFRQVLMMFVVYGLVWGVIGFGSYAFIRSLYPVGADDFVAITAAYSLSWAFGVAVFISPGGVGTRDAAYYACLSTILPGKVAIAIAIASRIFQTATELVYVGAVTGIDKAYRKKRTKA